MKKSEELTCRQRDATVTDTISCLEMSAESRYNATDDESATTKTTVTEMMQR